jgi:hypothetical protein
VRLELHEVEGTLYEYKRKRAGGAARWIGGAQHDDWKATGMTRAGRAIERGRRKADRGMQLRVVCRAGAEACCSLSEPNKWRGLEG